jgi:hypothetical protein
MAFVHIAAAAPTTLRASSFCSRAVSPPAPPASAATASRRAPSMLVEDGEVVSAKGSAWKSTLFGFDVCGGIPGGEVFYREWIENGMTDDFVDMPAKLQPSQPKVQRPPPGPTLLQRVDSMEFFENVEAPAPAAGGYYATPGAAAAAAAAATPAAPASPAPGSYVSTTPPPAPVTPAVGPGQPTTKATVSKSGALKLEFIVEDEP